MFYTLETFSTAFFFFFFLGGGGGGGETGGPKVNKKRKAKECLIVSGVEAFRYGQMYFFIILVAKKLFKPHLPNLLERN